jgi:hypothetical protein
MEDVLFIFTSWINIPNLLLTLYMDNRIKDIVEVLGTYINYEASYKTIVHHSTMKILVALDPC